MVALCGALAPQGTPRPELACESVSPEDRTSHEVVEVPPIQLMGVRNGAYVLYLQPRDRLGHPHRRRPRLRSTAAITQLLRA